MALFTIDESLCARDGLCARECPVSCIDWEKDGLPAENERTASRCIDCGHCMAVCPKGALQLTAFDSPARAYSRKDLPSPEQAELLLASRRSVREYREDPVDHDTLTRLLDISEYAPSGHNARMVDWTVADSREKVETVCKCVAEWMDIEVKAKSEKSRKYFLPGILRAWRRGNDLISRGAPALAVCHAPDAGATPLEDAVIALTYLELAAHSHGLGACWGGLINFACEGHAPLRELLGVPEGSTVHGVLMIGRPKIRYSAVPPRHPAGIHWL